MRNSVPWVALVALIGGCGEEKQEEPFGLDPPAPGHQIHIERQTLDPNTRRTLCEEHTLTNEQQIFVPSLQLLATTALERLEVYAIDEGTGADAVDCAILPVSVMGDLSKPIRMIYQGEPAVADDEVSDDFSLPGGAAIPLGPAQVLLLRTTLSSGTEEEDFELFLNLPTVGEADLVAAPYTFSIDDLLIGVSTNRSFSTTCNFVRDETILTVAGHQHAYEVDGKRVGAGTGVTVEHKEQVLLGGEAGPWALLDPLIVLNNDGLSFTCSYDNRSLKKIVHGTTQYDEMCRIFGWLYPAPNGAVLGATHPDGGQYICDVLDVTE